MAADQNPQQRVMPTLRMTDYTRSKQFYVDRLGFLRSMTIADPDGNKLHICTRLPATESSRSR